MVNKDNIKAVIFDIDGTLVDSFEAYYRVLGLGISHNNLAPVSREFLRDCLARTSSLKEILKKVFPAGTDDAVLEECRAEIFRLFKQAEAEEVKPFPGTEELLRYLQGVGVKIGIATGRMSSPEAEWTRFRRFGLEVFIGAIVTSREVVSRKPAPDAILECARRLGVPADRCMVVGDTESDIIAAKRAGAIAIAVTTAQEDEAVLLKAKPDIVFAKSNDLVTFWKTNER